MLAAPTTWISGAHITDKPTDTKPYFWGERRAGDCHETGLVLLLYSDGSLKFCASVWTDSTWSGDIWHSQFELRDGEGDILDITDTYDSPVMKEGPHYDYCREGRFEPDMFDKIKFVQPVDHCWDMYTLFVNEAWKPCKY